MRAMPSRAPAHAAPAAVPAEGRPRLLLGAAVVAFLFLYLLPIGVRPVASPDEVRNGAIVTEMLASGDWVVPRFNGVRYFEKPVLGYWLDAASLAAFGRTPFALRLPQALATALAGLIVYAFARRFATRSAGARAALIFMTTFLVAGAGTFAVLDAFLALSLTAALAAFYCALRSTRRRERLAWLAACGAACGAGFLVKGFLAFAIPVVVAVPYLALRRRWQDLLLAPWLPLATAVLVALPWALAIARREPDFWHYFFWIEHVQRFVGGARAQHAQPFWYHVAYLPLTCWPWIALLPAAIAGAWAARRNELFAFIACWFAGPLVLFSASSGKLPTYILPCLAPLALFLALALEPQRVEPYRRALRAAAVVVGGALVALLAATIGAEAFAHTPPYGTDETLAFGLLVGSLGLGVRCAALARARAARPEGLVAFAACGAALMLPVQLALPQRVLEHVAPADAVATLAADSGAALLVASAGLAGTVAWVFARDDVAVLEAGELEYGLSYPDGAGRLLDDAALERAIVANRGRRETIVIADEGLAQRLEAVLAPANRRRLGEVIAWRIPP